MMEKVKTDVLIIGAGPGGYVAAIYASKQGRQVTLVDKEWVGGTCLNVGCIPTKALVQSAEAYHGISKQPGIHVDGLTIDLEEVISHKNKVKDQLVSGIEFLLNKYQVNYIKGTATFVDDNTVKVNDTLFQPNDIIIATGSTPKHLPIEGKDLAITSRELLDLTKKPESLVIIGGGIIGMEFAFIFANMGVSVTVIEFLPRILAGVDKEIALRLMPYTKKADIKVITNAKVVRIEEEGQRKRVVYEKKDQIEGVFADVVLEAIGRKPLVDGLGLEHTHLQYDQRNGISVD